MDRGTPTNDSGSTSILGNALLNFMSLLLILRQFLTTSTLFLRWYDSMAPFLTLAFETNITLARGTNDYANPDQCHVVAVTEWETHGKHWSEYDGLNC